MDLYSTYLLKLRIDSLTNRKLVCFWVVFAWVLIVVYSSCAFVSQEPEKLIKGDYSCQNSNQFETGYNGKELEEASKINSNQFCPFWEFNSNKSWEGKLSGYSNFNKYILMEIKPLFKEDFNYTQYIDHKDKSSQDYVYTKPSILQKRESEVSNVKARVNFVTSYIESDATGKVIKNKSNQPKNITFICDLKKKKCKEEKIWYKPTVTNYVTYEFSVEFENNDMVEKDWFLKNAFTEFQIIGKTGDTNFFMFVVIIKYIFLSLSVTSTIFYLMSYSNMKHSARVFEQNAILYLSLFQVGFNDPFYPITQLFPNPISITISTLATCAFFSYLLYFWLVLFHRFYADNNLKACTTDNYWKKVLALITCIVTTTANSVHSNLHVNDPAFKLHPQNEWIYDVALFFVQIFQTMIMLIIFLFVVKVFKDWNLIIQRHKVSMLFSQYFIAIIALFIFTANIEIYYENGDRAMLIVSISNIYVYFQQYLYSPTQEGLDEWNNINQIKKIELGEYGYDERDMGVIDYRSDKYTKVSDDSLKAGD